MRAFLQIIFPAIIALLFTYIGIAMFAGKYTASPVVQLIGPGDRPSVCAERARPYFERNEAIMREISEAVIESQRFTDIWVTHSGDPASWTIRNINEELDFYDDVEATQDDVDVFLPMFEKLEIDNFHSPVLFEQNTDTITVLQFTSTCGPSIVDWLKFRLGLDGPAKGKPIAFALGFQYSPNGVHDISSCPEPLPDFDGSTLLCEVAFDENWTWGSRWASEVRPNIMKPE